MPALDNIRVVLVRPTHPGNIGATARAMHNMALRQLVLVAPECAPLLHPEAVARASDGVEVLRAARIAASLDEAIADCVIVIGTSSRARRIEWPTLSPRAAAAQALAAGQTGPVAIVFGQERTGLTNDELDHCQLLVTIPVNPQSPSLNLAAAVQVLAYELFVAAAAESGVTGTMESPQIPVSQEEMERFYTQLEAVLVETRFLDPGNPRHLMRRLRRLFARARPDQIEMNILRGILTAVQTGQRKS
jgi:TrmH family RNA methyltransferase